jgi:hypothetical protein
MPPPADSDPPPIAWIELPDQGTITLTGDCHIGRVEGNEIVNPDNRISRRHAVIQRQGQRFVLVDLGSTNGTFLNETRIFTARKLHHNDVILVGSLRYIFHQPSLTDVSSVGESAQHTVVSVGKTSCWMMLVAPPEPADSAATAWAAQVRQAFADAGAGLKRIRGAAIFAHWRDSKVTPEKIGALLQAVARLPCPTGARLTVHHGAVRVGPAAAGEENLLGAEATFTHKMEATAAALGVNFLLSEAAVHALGPASFVSPLGAQTMRNVPTDHPLFTISVP